MAIAIGIDFEHIHHTPAYRSLPNNSPIDIDLPRLTAEILELFEQYDVTATFFVVAELAEEHPALIRDIANRGHEVASHTFSHCSLTDVDNDVCAEELNQSKQLLERVIDDQVWGLRAPTCRIDDLVYRELGKAEYKYSSSVMPSVPIPGFYSNEYSFSNPTAISVGGREVMEIPISVHPSLRFPLSGAWIRLLGRTYTHHGIRTALEAGRHVITYSHPWEFASLQETSLPIRSRVRTGEWMSEIFESIVSLDREFCTVSDLVERVSPTAEYTIHQTERQSYSR